MVPLLLAGLLSRSFSSPTARMHASALVRTASIRASSPPQPTAVLNNVIDELLDAPDVNLPSIMSKRLPQLTDARFISVLNERIEEAPSQIERSRLEACQTAVITFLEELVSQVTQLEPSLAQAEKEAQEAVSRAEKQAKQASAERARKPARRAPSAGSEAASTPVTPKGMVRSDTDDESLEREMKARNRYKLEQLLDAAKVSMSELDRTITRMRSELDKSFFDHMQWEVQQQIKAKNLKLLGILELVVQRTCAEFENDMPELKLLGALLQTKNVLARQEMYSLNLRPATPEMQARFVMNVEDTKLHLEKAVMRGEQVDMELLQSIRVIAIEMEEYLASPESP